MYIRKAELNDVIDISRIHALSWKAAYKSIVPQKYLDELKEDFWVDAFNNWIKNDILTAKLIFNDDNIPVGCAAYGNSRDKSLPDWGEIISVYIRPDFFKMGFGTCLFNAVIQDMKNMGYSKIYLWVLENNLNAKRFYEKQGFTDVSDKCYCEILGKTLTDIRYIYSFS